MENREYRQTPVKKLIKLKKKNKNKKSNGYKTIRLLFANYLIKQLFY